MLDKVLEGGGEPAVAVGDRGLTYGELRECAAAVAKHFDGAERVAVWAENDARDVRRRRRRARHRHAARAGQPEARPRRSSSTCSTDSKPDVIFGGPDGIAVDLDARASGAPRRAPRPTRTRR